MFEKVWGERGLMAIVASYQLWQLPQITDQRGCLTFIEGGRNVPFEIKRVYYLYDIPDSAQRGGHAHKRLEQVMIAVSGSFEIIVDDGRSRRLVLLNHPRQGLYVGGLIWREMSNFSSGAVCLVLASECYDEADYYRDYNEFLAAVRHEE
jgi:hypothetical protein